MAAETNTSLADLAPLPPVGLGLRIATSSRVRRAIPRQVGFAAARLLNTYRWRDAAYRDRCAASMRFALEKSVRAPDAAALAKEFGYHAIKRHELLWRPWLSQEIDATGGENLAAAHASGRGVLMSFMHHAWFVETLAVARRHGFRLSVVVADTFLAGPPPGGYRGRRLRRHLLSVAQSASVLPAHGALPRVRELLANREIVAISYDVAGRTPTQFLGRTVYAAPVLARIAMTTGALVIPATMWKHRDLGRVALAPALDPQDFASTEELHAALARAHEPAVLAWPEALDWPLERWSDTPARPLASNHQLAAGVASAGVDPAVIEAGSAPASGASGTVY